MAKQRNKAVKKVVSAETRQRLSEAATRRWAKQRPTLQSQELYPTPTAQQVALNYKDELHVPADNVRTAQKLMALVADLLR